MAALLRADRLFECVVNFLLMPFAMCRADIPRALLCLFVPLPECELVEKAKCDYKSIGTFTVTTSAYFFNLAGS